MKARFALLLPFYVLAGATPALAQHMNASDAPCQKSGTTADTGACFVRAAKDADAKLNKVYARIQASFEADKRTGDGDALRKAQRAWLAYRDANCTAVYGLYGGGTGGPPNREACLEAVTRQRIADLEIGYNWILGK